MAQVQLKHLSKRYAHGTDAVRDFSLEVNDGEFLILAGPSGCGKSTMLRMIAGLEPITSGELWIDGQLMNAVPPGKRDIAMVFQNYALYPHKSVYENMAFSLRNAGMPKPEIDAAVQRAAKLLDLPPELLSRKPAALSGGQRQRVAMGRAIVRQPKVFLMDEPLSNLDAQLRVQMRAMIARLHAELGATFIYVTHDQTEAITLGTRIAVMKDGEIQQVGTPTEVYEAPANAFVAGFIGSPQMNLLASRLVAAGESGLDAECAGFRIPLGGKLSARLKAAGFEGTVVRMGIRPEHVRILGEGDGLAGGEVALEARIGVVEPLGAATLVYCDAGRTQIASLGTERGLQRGDTVRLAFNEAGLRFFDAETGAALGVDGSL